MAFSQMACAKCDFAIKRYTLNRSPRLDAAFFVPRISLPSFKELIASGVGSKNVCLNYKDEPLRPESENESKISEIEKVCIYFKVFTNDGSKVEIVEIIVPISVDSLAEFKAKIDEAVTPETIKVILDGYKCDNEYELLDVLCIDVIFAVEMASPKSLELMRKNKILQQILGTCKREAYKFAAKYAKYKTAYKTECVKYAKIVDECSVYKSELDGPKAENKTLKDSLELYKAENDKIAAENKTLKDSLELYKAENDKIAAESKTLKDSLELYKAENDKIAAESKTLKDSLDLYKAEKDKIAAEHKALQDAFNLLKFKEKEERVYYPLAPSPPRAAATPLEDVDWGDSEDIDLT